MQLICDLLPNNLGYTLPNALCESTTRSDVARMSEAPPGLHYGGPVHIHWDLGDGAEGTLRQLAGGTEPGGEAHAPEGPAVDQGDLDRLEKGAGGNLMSFPKGKSKVLETWGRRSQEALTDAEPVLSTDVRLTRGRRRSERRLLLLQEELVIAKLQRGTTVRPQLRLALDQLWVLSGGKEAAGEEKEEEGGDEDRTSILLMWPSGSCVATFPSRALKELWVGTLLGTPEGAKRARVTPVPSIKLLKKELSHRHAWRTFSAGSLERLMEGQAEAGPKQGPPTVPSSDGGALCHAPGEFREER
ncbi:uncharacterized protein LOC128150437 [Harpia harpyja]|uniref:uncharacterized protein LOC128150434 n=1 Tax=Harpia harpyja TaxID=202280 RepID=UPI0022B1291B|nr:uncharacterized protein LOC128150434 [Harpia harpyja]XP_052662564.1 uncharacterized protein LOC128150437 [Harpia harpyja]